MASISKLLDFVLWGLVLFEGLKAARGIQPSPRLPRGKNWRANMLLSDDRIKSQNLVHNYIDRNFRATSYDLTIGEILGVDATEKKQLILPPSGVAEVISRERITLPRDITGLAMVKTDLCNRGILALNIGIIGPGYDGHLSSTLLNFSKTDFLLAPNEVFLRLIFQECYVSSRLQWPKPTIYEEYVAAKKKNLVNFSEKFLNLDTIIKDISTPIWKNLRNQALAVVPLFVLGLALITFLLTVTVNYANRYVWSADDVKKQNVKQEILKDIDRTRQDSLELKILKLEQDLQTLATRQSQSVGVQPARKNQ
jgi:dUTPase